MSRGREWSVMRARAVAQAALASGAVPGDGSGLELIRLGTNGVFRSGLVVIRVSPPGTDLRLVQQQLDLARWLVDRGFPTAAPMSERPVVVDGQVVTAWKLVAVTGNVADPAELGRLLRRFHLLTDDYDSVLPPWEPLGRLGTRLVEAPIDEAFTVQDRQLLCTCRDELTGAARATRWELRQGPIHGDLHSGNVVVSDGALQLLDLDRIAHGPREWDLIQPLAAASRFRDVGVDVEQFLAGYDWDVRLLAGHEVLVKLRLLFMTSWLLTLPRTPAVQREVRVRMSFWRTPDGAPRWSPV